MTEMYGSYSDEDLNDWERFPQIAEVLTSSAFGAWLWRRDKKMKKQEQKTDILDKIRAEIKALNPLDYVSWGSYEGHRGARDMKDDVLQIIDKYEESEVQNADSD